jgi:hypothetical protein
LNISRRDFLKLSGLALGGAFLPPTPPEEAPRQVQSLGRAVRAVSIYDRPSLKAASRFFLAADTVFNVYGTVLSDDDHYNRVWYETNGGYVYSGHAQPVRWELQTPMPKVPAEGFLGEVTVPFTHPLTFDELNKSIAWVKAEHIRRVPPEEVTPLSPEAADKRIEINLEKQTFQCFEGSRKVLDVLCSTGVYLRTEQNKRIYGTPSGDWSITRKRASRHMAGDDLAAEDFYDLPGVPWVSYFHWWGVSIHGTYWHNDYGKPHSHGCINLPPETAKWVFRWSLPLPAIDRKLVEGRGTQVIVT